MSSTFAIPSPVLERIINAVIVPVSATVSRRKGTSVLGSSRKDIHSIGLCASAGRDKRQYLNRFLIFLEQDSPGAFPPVIWGFPGADEADLILSEDDTGRGLPEFEGVRSGFIF